MTPTPTPSVTHTATPTPTASSSSADTSSLDATAQSLLGLDSSTASHSSVSYTLGATVTKLILDGHGDINATGNALANVLIGQDGDNTLDGGAGNDVLYGGEGNDVLIGGPGADKMYGGSGANVINGGAGNDLIDGGGGNDTLIGGTGIDTFVFEKGSGKDVINDFGLGGEHDIIDISAYTSAGYKATVKDSGANVVISFSTGDTITLLGVHAKDLVADTVGYHHI